MLMIDGQGIVKENGSYLPISALGDIVLERGFSYKLMNGIEATVHPETRLLVWTDNGPEPKDVFRLDFEDKVMVKMWQPKTYKTIRCASAYNFDNLGRINCYEERRALAIAEGQSLGLMNGFGMAGEGIFQKFLMKNRDCTFSKQGYTLMSEIQQICFTIFGSTINILENPNGYRYGIKEHKYFGNKDNFLFIPIVSLTKHNNKRHLVQIDSSKLVTSNGVFLQH